MCNLSHFLASTHTAAPMRDSLSAFAYCLLDFIFQTAANSVCHIKISARVSAINDSSTGSTFN